MGDMAVEEPAESRKWAGSHGTYIAGRAYMDEADHTAIQMEAKWGCDRLRLLVGPELREKFDRQRYLFNQAIWHGELEDVRRESMRMVKAWLALDAGGCGDTRPRHADVWEVPLGGRVSGGNRPQSPRRELRKPVGRNVTVYTLEEIGRLLSAWPELAKAKETFPGQTIDHHRGQANHHRPAARHPQHPQGAERRFARFNPCRGT
jgi:hypothetical protein